MDRGTKKDENHCGSKFSSLEILGVCQRRLRMFRRPCEKSYDRVLVKIFG